MIKQFLKTMNLTKFDLKSILKSNTSVEITFTKVNGEKRVMNCTLHESVLPKVDLPIEPSNRKAQSDSIISVWDIDEEGWRSFRVANLVDYKL